MRCTSAQTALIGINEELTDFDSMKTIIMKTVLVQVIQCRREDVQHHIATVDLAVPLMARLDADTMDRAPRLKAILQYGVGVEGIDIPAVGTRHQILLQPSRTCSLFPKILSNLSLACAPCGAESVELEVFRMKKKVQVVES